MRGVEVTLLSCLGPNLSLMHIDFELPVESAGSDIAWVRTCASRLAALDSLLDPEDAECVADEMAQHEHWRKMQPGVAATSMMFESEDLRRRQVG